MHKNINYGSSERKSISQDILNKYKNSSAGQQSSASSSQNQNQNFQSKNLCLPPWNSLIQSLLQILNLSLKIENISTVNNGITSDSKRVQKQNGYANFNHVNNYGHQNYINLKLQWLLSKL